MIYLHACSAQAPDHLEVQVAADIDTDLMQPPSPLRQLDQRISRTVEESHHIVDNPLIDGQAVVLDNDSEIVMGGWERLESDGLVVGVIVGRKVR